MLELESGGVVEDELESGGVVVPELEAGGAVSLGGGDEDIEDVEESPFGELDGVVDCCFEQADIATNAPRHNRSMLRFIKITSLCRSGISTPAA